MPEPRVSIVVPSLHGGETLSQCLQSLSAQTFSDFETIVVDNSGTRAASVVSHAFPVRIIENSTNTGFGAAVNQGIRASSSQFVVTLNDDTIAHPGFLDSLVAAAEQRYEIGMCAPQIRLFGDDRLDSAGMLLCRDGSSKQRGHLEPPASYKRLQQVLLPSGCAALYRRDMLDEIGLFDERFFLYCEDTDLGLRGRWKLWECMYVPAAIVEHRYSLSAGSASALKAYYVERNRLFVAFKNFPARELAAVPFVSALRYFWHSAFLLSGRGKAAAYAGSPDGHAARLPWYVLRAWAAVFPELPRLLAERRAIQRGARMQTRQFRRLLSTYSISARRVAAL